MKKLIFSIFTIIGLASCEGEDQRPVYELVTTSNGHGMTARCDGPGTTCTKQRKNQLEAVNLFHELVSALERAVADDKISEFMQTVEAQQLFPTFFAENRAMVDQVIQINPKGILLNDKNLLVLLRNRSLPFSNDNILYAIELI
jgi:hypothetical protein